MKKLLFALLLTAPVIGQDWTPGSPLESTSLPGGMKLDNPVLLRIDPDAIVVTHADGVARIAMEDLAPEAREELGFDPKDAEIARLKREISELEGRLKAATNQVKPAVASEQKQEPTKAGFEAFLKDQQNISGERLSRGDSRVPGFLYQQGPFKGLTKGQGESLALRQWEAMSTERKMVYERRAKLISDGGGDGQAKNQRDSEAKSALRRVQFVRSGENGWMSTDGSVRIRIEGDRLRIEER